jgi:NTE family protein
VSERRRALVLGSGGVTGIAWELGVLDGLQRAGLVLEPDLVVGTSAGAVVGAWLAATGSLPPLAVAGVERAGRLGPAPLALAIAQLSPSRRHALAWLGARARRSWTAAAERAWLDRFAGLAGRPWPAGLVVVASDTASGRPAFLGPTRPVPLDAAVAASCALPGVFPAVRIEEHLLFDGGLRSPANLDLATGADAVVAIAPLTGSVRPHRRPAAQAAELAASGTAVVLIEPDAAGRRAIGLDVLDVRHLDRAFAAGRATGERRGREAVDAWNKRR